MHGADGVGAEKCTIPSRLAKMPGGLTVGYSWLHAADDSVLAAQCRSKILDMKAQRRREDWWRHCRSVFSAPATHRSTSMGGWTVVKGNKTFSRALFPASSLFAVVVSRSIGRHRQLQSPTVAEGEWHREQSARHASKTERWLGSPHGSTWYQSRRVL